MANIAKLKTIPISRSFFDKRKNTLVTWLGMAGALVNSRGTIVFIDPLITEGAEPELCESGHRRLIPPPIWSHEVPKADIICYTHSEGDHFGKPTASILDHNLAPQFIVPPPVAVQLRDIDVEEDRIIIAKDFASISFGDVEIVITPALHDHQAVNAWKRGDCCGFLIKTQDGTIWHPGDTRLISELEQVTDVDVLFFDVAAVNAHLGPEGSARLAETSAARRMVAYHYGTYDLPPGSYGGCNPNDSLPYVEELLGVFLQPSPGEILDLPILQDQA